MEATPKKRSIAKEERPSKMEPSCVSAEEIDQKNGDEKKIGEGSSFRSSSPTQKDSNPSNQVSMNTSSRQSPPKPKSSNIAVNQEDQLESTKAEMGEVREENERLKTLLARIVKDYQSLQMHFFDIVQQEQSKKPSETYSPAPTQDAVDEPDHLVSLSLGTSPSLPKKDEKITRTTSSSKVEEGLTLGLDCRFEANEARTSPSNSVEEKEEEEEVAGEPWPPSKILKSMQPSGGEAEDQAAHQAHVKKTRVSVRARCDAPTMYDGCQWRKYGQKIAKGNPCPRAYYRCTVAPACPVRKQVQRCAEDMSILITTYEGTHNHPLPISATAMASTTSAAACMLMSGSTASRSPVLGSPPTSSPVLPALPSTISSTTPNLHSLNFNLSDPNSSRSRPFYLPNPTISSTPSYPTITLDLTSRPQTTSQASQFTTRFSSSNFTTSAPRFSAGTCFSFSSSDSNPSLAPPTSWANGSPYLSHAAHSQHYAKTPVGYQSYLQKLANPSTATRHALTDTIAKAITSDPSFQSALAAAITSYVGGPSGGQVGGGEGVSHGLQHSSLAPYAAVTGVNGCGSSFMTRTGSGSGTNAQQGSLVFLQNPLGLPSSSKSASASPVDNRESNN